MNEVADKRDGTRAPMTLAASFTLGPVLDHLAQLSAQLAWPAPIKTVPYGRFAAQLLDRAGHFWAPSSFRAILLQPSDLGSDVLATRQLIEEALATGDDGTILRIIIGDADRTAEEKACAAVQGVTRSSPHIEVVSARQVFDRYSLSEPFDELTSRTGHLPYADDGMSTIALDLGRQIDCFLRPPVKLIAVDGDNTLWSGVLGEDGVEGVQIGDGHVRLQETLSSAARQGVILTLLTKNEEADIQELFSARQDFPLGTDDFFEIHAGWNEKSDNLAHLAARQGVSQEATLFLDDSPVEVARMREAMPGVLSIEMKAEGFSASFVDSLWPLDRKETTRDDKQRVRRLKEEAVRQHASRQAGSLSDFFTSLELKIDIFEPGAHDISRLSQLSQRTNQFNTSLLRLSEAEFASRAEEEKTLLRAIRVADRFGDYGLVGTVLGVVKEEGIELDLFSLSCRVLGRGVEHHTLRWLIENTNASTLTIHHVTGPRNQPVRRFLEQASGQSLPEEGRLSFGREDVLALQFDPNVGRDDSETLIAPALEDMTGRGAFYQSVANLVETKNTPSDVFFRQNKRPELFASLIPPRGIAEQKIAMIWQDVLGVSPLGRDDDFSALGGKSLDLVRIHARLVREMEVDLSLADLFRFSTVRELAEKLSATSTAKPDRATAMRNARMRRPRRTV